MLNRQCNKSVLVPAIVTEAVRWLKSQPAEDLSEPPSDLTQVENLRQEYDKSMVTTFVSDMI